MTETTTTATLPWWRVPIVWLVIGGPAAVVLAGLFTAVLAVRGADRPLPTTPSVTAETMTPATQARNHAGAPAR